MKKDIAYWLSKDKNALAELFVLVHYNILSGVIEGVKPISWHSVLVPKNTFYTREEAVRASLDILQKIESQQGFNDFMNEMRKFNGFYHSNGENCNLGVKNRELIFSQDVIDGITKEKTQKEETTN